MTFRASPTLAAKHSWLWLPFTKLISEIFNSSFDPFFTEDVSEFEFLDFIDLTLIEWTSALAYWN